MRPGQNRRMRGRNNNNNSNNGNRKAPNPLQRSYESNGPDVKVRGTAQNVAEKYLQLARDAQSSGDHVGAENYFQHAEHYYRILLAAQEQMSQQFGHSFPPARGFVDDSEEGDEDGDDEPIGQPGAGPQPELRNGYNGHNNGHNGPRHDAENGEAQGQRFDRPPRGERPAYQSDRQPNPNDRSPRRFDRNDRQDRGQERSQDRGQDRTQDRTQEPRGGERGERRFDRQDTGYQPREQRPEAPRGEGQASLAPSEPEAGLAPRDGERRFERGPRPERGERRPRREPDSVVEADDGAAVALPSFLTTPVRVPVAVAEDAAAPESGPAEDGASDEQPRRTRRRRSPREVMDALGSETDAPAE